MFRNLFRKPKIRPDARDTAIRATILRNVAKLACLAPSPQQLAMLLAGKDPSERTKLESTIQSAFDQTLSSLGSIKNYFSPWEQEFFRTPPLALTARQRMNASWRIESTIVMLWALRMIDQIPPYDKQAEPGILKDFSPEDLKSFIASAVLREAAQIDRARDLAELWHWRSRTRQLIERGGSVITPEMEAQGIRSIDDIVRNTARGAANAGDFEACDEDFPAFGKPYRDLTQSEWSVVRSISAERHFALNWLCGFARVDSWDDTPTDT